jgi:N-acetylmuramoyl-L-alanine amidase
VWRDKTWKAWDWPRPLSGPFALVVESGLRSVLGVVLVGFVGLAALMASNDAPAMSLGLPGQTAAPVAAAAQLRAPEDSQPRLQPAVVTDPSDIARPGESADPPLDPAAALEARVQAMAEDARPLDADTMCMAKAIYHEAVNQPLEGQLAIAQLILNRARSGMFPNRACAVVNQKGQFFQTRSYHAPTGSKLWKIAVAVARLAQEESLPQVEPGALFYHASYVRPTWRRHHTRVGQVGEHIFYR